MLIREEVIEAFDGLGKYFQTESDDLSEIYRNAEAQNPWFTQESIRLALNGFCNQYLDKSKLISWCKDNRFNTTPKMIAIIMAGNIPLVGFHDLLSVLVSGNKALVKLSSKDEVLMRMVIEKLKEIEPKLIDRITISEGTLSNFDAVIATGNNNSARYFEYYFGKYPNIIRKNRNAVAILTGKETKDDLLALGTDIFSFFGLGCRNVSKLFVPKDYDFRTLMESLDSFKGSIDCTKYKNNFDYSLTLYLLNKLPYLANDCIVLTEDDAINSRIAVVHYTYYDSIDEINAWLAENEDSIQCVIGENHIPFGKSQTPALDDYADDVNTLAFLEGLK